MSSEKLGQFNADIRRLWRLRKSEPFLGWHGFSTSEELDSLIVTLFVKKGTDTRDLEAAVSKTQSAAQIKIHRLQQFQQNGTSAIGTPGFPGPLAPGAPVTATSASCPGAVTGTIGAFLRQASAPNQGRWLLSNNHVLVKSTTCLPGVNISSNGFKVSDAVTFVPIDPTNDNKVDAAIAPLLSTVVAQSQFPAALGLKDNIPVPLVPGRTVLKFGSRTGVTTGIVGNTVTIEVVDVTGLAAHEFSNQVVVQSSNQDPFSCRGDSGSLVVQDGHPAGLLIADIGEGDCSKLGLVTPFQTVLDEFQRVQGMKFEMVPPGDAV